VIAQLDSYNQNIATALITAEAGTPKVKARVHFQGGGHDQGPSNIAGISEGHSRSTSETESRSMNIQSDISVEGGPMAYTSFDATGPGFFMNAGNEVIEQSISGSATALTQLNSEARSTVSANSGGVTRKANINIDSIGRQDVSDDRTTFVTANIKDSLGTGLPEYSDGKTEFELGGVDIGMANGSVASTNETGLIETALHSGTAGSASSTSTLTAKQGAHMSSTSRAYTFIDRSGPGELVYDATHAYVATNVTSVGGGVMIVRQTSDADGISGTPRAETESTTTTEMQPVVPAGGGLDLPALQFTLRVEGQVTDFASATVTFTYAPANAAPQSLWSASATVTASNGGTDLSTGGVWGNSDFALDEYTGGYSLVAAPTHFEQFVVGAGDKLILTVVANTSVRGLVGTAGHGEIQLVA
jgi:hypothetical protein